MYLAWRIPKAQLTWVCLPGDPPPSREIARVWYNHSLQEGPASALHWSCTRWEMESCWRLIIRPPIFQCVGLHRRFPAPLVWGMDPDCSYVLNSRPELPPCLESLGKILVGLSSGDSITLLVDFTVTWTMNRMRILISVVPAEAVEQLCSLWGVDE